MRDHASDEALSHDQGAARPPHAGELEFHCLLEKLPAGAYTCSPDGLITYCNQHAVRLWGRAPKLNDPRDRFCGSFKLYSTDGTPIAHDRCWMALALQTGKEYNGHEVVIERPDGRRITALAHANPIRDESGALLGSVNVLVDISDRKRDEDALKETDRFKNEFIATLAHELRNPLAPIRNAVQILHLKSVSVPELQWALGVIDRQLQQMTRLVDDLLDVARINGNKLELRQECVDLAEVLHAAVETSRPLIEAYGQEFIVTASSPLYVQGDSTRLAQVISNLLNNAVRYTPQGGRIRLTAERQDGQAVVTVRDTGVGIPPEMLDRIFEMFTQVDRSLDRSRVGLGIGLTLARRLVELHGGAITARSEGPGKGSEFVVRLPAVAEPSAGPNRAGGHGERGAPAAVLRILIVDDDRDSAASLAMLLRIMGHEVRTAYDGGEAVAAAVEFRPDAVLLDIGLPGMNGYDVACRIRREPCCERAVLIAVTGWGQDADRRRSKDAGCDYHLVKPVDSAALVRLLASLNRTAPDQGSLL